MQLRLVRTQILNKMENIHFIMCHVWLAHHKQRKERLFWVRWVKFLLYLGFVQKCLCVSMPVFTSVSLCKCPLRFKRATVHVSAGRSVFWFVSVFCRVALSQGQASVAMVNVEFKKLSSLSAQTHYNISLAVCPAWDCDAACQLANRAQTEWGLLLGGVAWKRVSWVFSLSLLLSHCTHWLHLIPLTSFLSLSLFALLHVLGE